ncbi:guanylate cyclase soluble subunit alpha-1-like [Heptranchias perlo]|uniref:guanylate cyclase soluble subunit alpha-1-like n=1 Tax=Heptranchias perlo TaxID=212740 RepID=UPI00355A2C06
MSSDNVPELKIPTECPLSISARGSLRQPEPGLFTEGSGSQDTASGGQGADFRPSIRDSSKTKGNLHTRGASIRKLIFPEFHRLYLALHRTVGKHRTKDKSCGLGSILALFLLAWLELKCRDTVYLETMLLLQTNLSQLAFQEK